MPGHNFIRERPTSLTWPLELDSPDWQSAHHNSTIGPMSSEPTPANRLAHELFHTIHSKDSFSAKIWDHVVCRSLSAPGGVLHLRRQMQSRIVHFTGTTSSSYLASLVKCLSR